MNCEPKFLRKRRVSTPACVCAALWFSALAGLAFAMTGCVPTRYQVKVEAFADPDLAGYKSCPRYLVLSGQNKEEGLDLEFKEYGAQVRRMLEAKGYVYDLTSPCQVVFLSYSISGPARVPRVTSSPEYSYINKRWVTTGSRIDTAIETYYTRTVVIEAMDVTFMDEFKRMLPLWKVKVTSVGASESLREAFPYLLKATELYVGTSGNHTVDVFIKDMQVIEGKELPLHYSR